MIVQEFLDENTVRTYSDANFYIYGGFPEGNYIEAIDPVDKGRTYIETNIPIEEDTDDEESENENNEEE